MCLFSIASAFGGICRCRRSYDPSLDPTGPLFAARTIRLSCIEGATALAFALCFWALSLGPAGP